MQPQTFINNKCKIKKNFSDGMYGWLLTSRKGSDNVCHMFPHLFLCVASKWHDDENAGSDKRMTGVLFIFCIFVQIFTWNYSSLWQNSLSNWPFLVFQPYLCLSLIHLCWCLKKLQWLWRIFIDNAQMYSCTVICMCKSRKGSIFSRRILNLSDTIL